MYKRQVALLAALMLLVSGCGEKQETPDGAPDEPLMQEEDLTIEPQPDANFTPVSYTHLDVYKRQLLRPDPGR